MPTQDHIIVEALIENNNVIIPKFEIGTNVQYMKNLSGDPFSAINYRQLTPTLAELVYAFFTTDTENRMNFVSKPGYGEWTSTFLQDGKKAVERPENVVYRNGVWVVEGGKVTPVELPPAGWVMEYDKMTGFPSRTSKNKRDVVGVFEDISYFAYNGKGLRPVMKYRRKYRLFNNYGPFFIHAVSYPDYKNSNVGGRDCKSIE